jgi:hypothetical protein
MGIFRTRKSEFHFLDLACAIEPEHVRHDILLFFLRRVLLQKLVAVP